MAHRNSVSWKMKTIANSIAYNQVPYIVLSNKAVKKSKKKIIILAVIIIVLVAIVAGIIFFFTKS